MATLPSSTTKTLTLTLNSSDFFIDSYKAFSQQSPQISPPLSFSLLSQQSPLPPIPTDFPQSKLIPKTRFIIDGFRYSGDNSVSYFLSHFHSDHYTGLNPSWSKGIIFCSEITARLLVEVLSISSLFVVSLSIREPVWIDGCEVTLIDANHCPGAVQFLFKIPGIEGRDERYVHTGDFRFCDSMKLEPILSGFLGADAIFLDTTYCNPKFVFPLQDDSIDYIIKAIERIRVEIKGSMKSVLFLIATYVVGKERILLEISRRCKCMIHVDGRKMAVLHTLGFGEDGIFTEDASASDVHVVGWNVLGETWPYFRPNFMKMKEIMAERGYSKIVGFVPTGWMYEAKRDGFAVRAKDSFEIHLVPYSEHSSYNELREYVRFLRPKRVIPTVGLNIEKLDSKHAMAMQKHFAGLVDEMANKQEFLMGFHRRSRNTDEKTGEAISNDLTMEINEEKGVESSKNILETLDNTDLGFVLDSASSLQEPSSLDSNLLNDKDKEGMIQELRDCLPVWVTRDQMLDLLSSTGGNIIEAASEFYERETEFHDQIIACSTSIATFETNSPSDSASLPELGAVGTSHGSLKITSSQDKKSPKTRQSIKHTASPRKRRTGLENQPSKKVRLSSPLESSKSKQSTITKFFSKLLPNASQVSGVDSNMGEQCLNNGFVLPRDATDSYKEELDQFLQVINGSVSRSYAASILEKAKGDINVALDIYYSNSGGNLGGDEGTAFYSESVRCVSSFSAGNERKSSEKTTNTANLYAQGISKGDVAATLVSLPLEKYSPIDHACWTVGQPAPYLHLARAFDLVEGERGKIKATAMLCNMFRSLLALSPKDVLPSVYLCLNKIAADHENMELNIGGSLVTAALEEACGTNKSKIRDMYNNLGDLGDVAQVCRQTQSLLAPPCPLLIQDEFISVEAGNGSTVRKKILIVNLMRSCREKEMKFLVRTLVRIPVTVVVKVVDFVNALMVDIVILCWRKTVNRNVQYIRRVVKNLRIGAMMRTVLPALAQAVVMNLSHDCHHEGAPESLKEKLQCISTAVVEAYNILPNLDLLVPSLMSKGIEFSSTTLSMVPGIPIRPMLARITNGVPEALKLFQGRAFTCEYKYDGQRAQIHKVVDGSVRVFSRSGDETTSRFPDVVNIIKQSCKTTAMTFILDAEVVAVDRKNGSKLMSFQELSSRERGSKDSLITVDSIKVEANDACLSDEVTLNKINSFLEDAFRSSCEGIMMKSLDVNAGYAPSKRTDTWLKVKRDYVEGMNDSLDLAPIGAWHGNGRKAGWYSPFLMACYNPDLEEFQSVCRVMSGFSDSFYAELNHCLNLFLCLLTDPIMFKIGKDLEWKLIYVGSAEDETYDQLLESVLVGPVNVGNYRFVFQADPPDPSKIREEDIIGVTVLLLTCSYLGQEFIRVGYYVNNDYDDEKLREEPPQKVLIDRVQRNILADKPRVTKFPINFHPETNENGGQPPSPDHPTKTNENGEQPPPTPDHPSNKQES
ncbi:hypothetical protein HHK36_024585 [Tetracentron sinense]|uniref:ATP-dependent DNA ligase family profile domain-containing protein n=1 Tax=Tetracentron sinense TaxID=13715 RepID=A0A835D7L8_TETSI|nr:hypothetical protein HHK36_024585 [Tetracentron sinense]